MLETRNLSAFYGRHKALENVSIHVEPGEICVVLGANGAGKSTLLKAIAGLVPATPDSQILIDGRPIQALKPDVIVESGIALVPEGRGIFGELTVRENLQLGAYARRARGVEKGNLERVLSLFPKLSERRAQVARTMSGGEQQMVAIGRALMSKPDILMLDEPSLGLSPLLCADLFKALKEVRKTGVGILLVEQNAKQSLAIADRGYLLENGHITGENTAEALASDPAVQRAYLGVASEGTTAQPGPALRSVALPPSGTARDIAQMAADLAKRAADIHSAYIASLRAVHTAGSQASPDARALAAQAADLARRAAEIHSAHIRSRRTGAVAETPPAAPRGAGELSAMAEDMAKRAADIHSAHIRARRAKG